MAQKPWWYFLTALGSVNTVTRWFIPLLAAGPVSLTQHGAEWVFSQSGGGTCHMQECQGHTSPKTLRGIYPVPPASEIVETFLHSSAKVTSALVPISTPPSLHHTGLSVSSGDPRPSVESLA